MIAPPPATQPGLSEHFLYLNDDVMFGEPVWPDDFYTESRGQKVVLAWPVPNCAEGCPSNWIGDKYCDAACNSTECDWDGGDCLKKAAEAAAAAHDAVVNKHTPSSAIHSFCEDGCSDAWLGDKYCDAACNKEQCGFDAGDCGVADIQASLPRLDVTWDTEVVDQTLLRTPSGQLPQAVYVNLTRLFGNSTITAGSYESEDVVAGAVVSQPDKVLVIVLRKGLNATMATFSVSAEGGPNGTAWTKSFNVTLQTTELTTTTLAPATLNASQLAANATALNTSAILGPNVTNGSQAMRLVDASAINYWDVAGNNTASTATPAPPPTKRATSAIFPVSQRHRGSASHLAAAFGCFCPLGPAVALLATSSLAARSLSAYMVADRWSPSAHPESPTPNCRLPIMFASVRAPQPPPKDLDRSTLPAEIQDSWASLSLELSAGDITEKVRFAGMRAAAVHCSALRRHWVCPILPPSRHGRKPMVPTVPTSLNRPLVARAITSTCTCCCCRTQTTPWTAAGAGPLAKALLAQKTFPSARLPRKKPRERPRKRAQTARTRGAAGGCSRPEAVQCAPPTCGRGAPLAKGRRALRSPSASARCQARAFSIQGTGGRSVAGTWSTPGKGTSPTGLRTASASS